MVASEGEGENKGNKSKHGKGNYNNWYGKSNNNLYKAFGKIFCKNNANNTEWSNIIGTRGVTKMMVGIIIVGMNTLGINISGARRRYWKLIRKTTTLSRTKPRHDCTNPNLQQADGMHWQELQKQDQTQRTMHSTHWKKTTTTTMGTTTTQNTTMHHAPMNKSNDKPRHRNKDDENWCKTTDIQYTPQFTTTTVSTTTSTTTIKSKMGNVAKMMKLPETAQPLWECLKKIGWDVF